MQTSSIAGEKVFLRDSYQERFAPVKKAGFMREGYSRRYLKVCGRWRDHERWAIIADDWKSKSRRSG